MMSHKVNVRSMRTQREIEFENEFETLRRRWCAYHEGNATDERALVEDTRSLERNTGMAPGTLLNGLRRGES
jgi:hypothetical protein